MKKLVLILLTVTLVVVSCGRPQKGYKKDNQNQKESILTVKTLVLKKRDYTQNVSYLGTFTSLKKYDIKAEASGQVIKLYKEVGDIVYPNTIIALIDPFTPKNNYIKTLNNLKSAKASLELAQLNFYNDSLLYSKNKISKLQFLQTKNNYYMALNQKTQAEIALKEAERIYKKTSVKPLYKGIISKRYINLGDYVTAGMNLFRINNLDEMIITISVTEEIVKNLKKNMIVDTVICDGNTYKGKIYSISYEASPQTGTYEVKILVNNKNYKILDGFSGVVHLDAFKYQDVYVIPKDAIIKRDDNTYVFLVKDGKIEEKRVTIYKDLDNKVLIKTGLNEGDRVVISKIEELRSGMKVNY